MALGFWMNNKNCYGCKTCSIACKSEKQLDQGVLLRHVTEIKQDDPRALSFLSLSCNRYDEQESKTYKCDMCTDRQERGELPACVAACPGMNLAVGEMADLEKAHQADIVSDDAVETKPNFVITVDPALSAEPDDTAVEARAAELAASKTAKKA